LEYNVTVTTIPLSYLTYCPYIVSGYIYAFPNTNFGFAGHTDFVNTPPLSPSDFTVSNGYYTPWAVNNAGTGTLPDGKTPISTGEANFDGGGVNFVISYQPNKDDRTSVKYTSINFVQGYVSSYNGKSIPPSTGSIDYNKTVNPNSPFYNSGYDAGTGTTYRTGTSPLVTSVNPAVPAWMGDGPSFGFPNQSDFKAFTYSVTFQAFIETTVGDTDLMLGGVQWGYTVTSALVPEPGTFTLAIFGALGVSVFLWKAPKEPIPSASPRPLVS
jgi:hypothetical protein